jgi:hypothetical protein
VTSGCERLKATVGDDLLRAALLLNPDDHADGEWPRIAVSILSGDPVIYAADDKAVTVGKHLAKIGLAERGDNMIVPTAVGAAVLAAWKRTKHVARRHIVQDSFGQRRMRL